MFKAATVEGDKIRVSFDHAAGGLIVGKKEGRKPVEAVAGGKLARFAIAGEDKKWVWATAKIVGNDKVEVSAAGVTKPVAVRYAWADNPVCNLFSKDGLPVTPFRSDEFEMLTKPKP